MRPTATHVGRSMVCMSKPVCVLDTLVSPVKTTELIELPRRLGEDTRAGSNVLNGVAHWHHLVNATQ